MQKLLLSLAILAVAAAAALAGPNAGGVLAVHDAGLAYTHDSASYPSAPPIDCGSIDVQLPAGPPPAGAAGYVWKVYAAFPAGSSPRLKALVMGESFDASVTVLTGGLPDPALDFEVPQAGWPTTSGGGVGVAFGMVKTALINECYWFAGYGDPGGIFAMVRHPVGSMSMVDDAVPANEDPIAGLGSIGFGVPGGRVCPEPPYVGACCLQSGACLMMQPNRCDDSDVEGHYVGGLCESAGCGAGPGACCLSWGTCYVWRPWSCGMNGGLYLGDGLPCTPNPCWPPPGACCLPDGTCRLLAQSACQAAQGLWQGQLVPCDPDPCPASDAPAPPPSASSSMLCIQPNPFTTRTSIRLRVHQPSTVRLTVIGPDGSVVRTERMQVASSGEQVLTWDARTNDGRDAPAGTYFVRVVTPEGEQVGRVVLLR